MFKAKKNTISIISLIFLVAIYFLSKEIMFNGASKIANDNIEKNNKIIVHYSVKLKSKYFQNDNYNLYVPEGSSLKGVFELNNGFPKEQTYGIIMVLDTEQIPYLYNNILSDFHTFKLKPNEKKEIAFKTLPINKSNSNLLVILVKNPFNYLKSNNFVPPEKNFLCARYKVNDTTNKKENNKFNFKIKDKYILSEGIKGIWILNPEFKGDFEKEIPVITKINLNKSKFNFDILYKSYHDNKLSSNLLILTFFNYRMRPIVIDDYSYNYLFFKYNPNFQIKIPAFIKDIEPGTHNFFSIAISNPWSNDNSLYYCITNKITISKLNQ
jgi:hypothetical protein